jgi:hypothetical protein
MSLKVQVSVVCGLGKYCIHYRLLFLQIKKVNLNRMKNWNGSALVISFDFSVAGHAVSPSPPPPGKMCANHVLADGYWSLAMCKTAYRICTDGANKYLKSKNCLAEKCRTRSLLVFYQQQFTSFLNLFKKDNIIEYKNTQRSMWLYPPNGKNRVQIVIHRLAASKMAEGKGKAAWGIEYDK